MHRSVGAFRYWNAQLEQLCSSWASLPPRERVQPLNSKCQGSPLLRVVFMMYVGFTQP